LPAATFSACNLFTFLSLNTVHATSWGRPHSLKLPPLSALGHTLPFRTDDLYAWRVTGVGEGQLSNQRQDSQYVIERQVDTDVEWHVYDGAQVEDEPDTKVPQLGRRQHRINYTQYTTSIKVKVKEPDLYNAFIEVPYTHGAQVRITQCYLQTTPYLPLPRKQSPDGVSQTEVADI